MVGRNKRALKQEAVKAVKVTPDRFHTLILYLLLFSLQAVVVEDI